MSYKLSDEVSMRLIQIFQEAVILGVDGADLLRQVKVVVSQSEEGVLVLDPDYAKQVEEGHKRLLDEANARAKQAETIDVGPQ